MAARDDVSHAHATSAHSAFVSRSQPPPPQRLRLIPCELPWYKAKRVLARARPPMLTDEEEQADQAIRQNAQKLSGIIDRHKKELNLPGVVGIYQVWDYP